MGHLRSIIGVIQNDEYVWSFDGMGAVRIWQRLDMQFYKAFNSGLQFITPPFIFDSQLFCLAPNVVRACPTATILDPNIADPKSHFRDLEMPPNSLFVVGLPVNDEVRSFFRFFHLFL